MRQHVCPLCDGAGENVIDGHTCTVCKGSGFLPPEAKLAS